ncbi:MAG: hypothetical protein VW270_05700 [Candidatus Poseidoniales archaeon]
MKIEHDMYNEIIDIAWSRQYKFTLDDGRVGYFNADYREIGSQDSGDIDIRLENIRDMRWANGSLAYDLPTIEQIRELLSVNGVEVKA